MAGTPDFLGRLRARLGFQASDSPFTSIYDEPPPPIRFQGQDIPTEGLSPEQVSALGTMLPEAAPEDDSGFSALGAIFDTLDMPGAFVRGLGGAGLSLAKGNLEEAGQRAVSAIPGSETLAPMLGMGKGTAPTGEDLLVDLGMERGSTAEDERRVRIATSAGMSEMEAREKFGKFGDKKPDYELQREFDTIAAIAQRNNPELDMGVTFDDTKAAADMGDVAGIGAEIALDPLTYLSFGLTGAGKLATAIKGAEKAIPGITKTLGMAKNLDEARVILRSFASELPAKQLSRIDDLLQTGFKSGEKLKLGETLAEQAKQGQRGIVNLPQFMGGEPLIKGTGLFEYGSKIAQTDLARAATGEGPGSALQEGIRAVYKPLQSFFSTSTGLPELDTAIKTGEQAGRMGLTKAGRELDRLSQEVRSIAKVKGLKEPELRATIGNLVESGQFADDIPAVLTRPNEERVKLLTDGRAAEDVMSRIRKETEPLHKEWQDASLTLRFLEQDARKALIPPSAEITGKMQQARKTMARIEPQLAEYKKQYDVAQKMSERATEARQFMPSTIDTPNPAYKGPVDPDIAHIAAGIAKINKEMADKSLRFHLPFAELDDDVLSYLRREITPEGRKLLDSKAVKDFEEYTGLEYSAKGSYLKGRTEKWKGKTVTEINNYMREKHGVKEFFHEDPLFATRRMVNQAQRAIGNAVFADEVVKRFGGAEGAKNTAFDLFKKLGLKTDDSLKGVGIPEEIYKFAVKARELQDKPTGFLKAYQGITNWMKATVTALFPAFHGRNMLENTFKNAIEGNVNPQNYKDAVQFLASAVNVNSGGPGFLDKLARGAKAQFQKAGKFSPEIQKLFKEAKIGDDLENVVDWMHASGVLENRITSELGAVLREGENATPASTAREAFTGIFGMKGAPIRSGMALASGTENLHRVSLFIDRLKKGFSAQEALDEVKRVFFDYRDLTKAESKFAKNFGFFYNFYRNNFRYITQKAYSNPVQTKLILEAFKEDPDNPRFRFLSQKGALKLGGMDISLGFLPQQQFNMFNLAEGDIFDKISGKLGQGIGTLNPILTNAADAAFQQDLYTGTPLEYKTRAADFSGLPKSVQDWVGYKVDNKGNHHISPTSNFVINFIPAFGRLMQSAIAWDAKDKSYVQKIVQLTAGIGSQFKSAEEMGKREIALLDRSITREAKALPLLKSVGPSTFAIDTRTKEGKIASALLTPSAQEIPTLLLDPEIAQVVLPYITVGKDGKPKMNRYLADLLDQLAQQKYPREHAVMQIQKLRSKVKIKGVDQTELSAQEAFSQMFGELPQ